MKTRATFIMLWAFLLLTINLFSQAPQKFSYQAVVRDDAGNIASDQSVGIKISILQGSADGTVVYSETHSTNTNSFGLVTLEIGGGTILSGDLSTMDWGSDTYFMKVEMDPAGGTIYAEMGISQILSVPYALHSKTAENVFSGDYLDLLNRPTSVSSFTNDAGYLTDFMESDPVFGIHVSSGILTSDITNWNTAFGWGDHSAQEYLTTEVDGSVTNEIQDLNLTGNTLTITNNLTPTSIDLNPYLDNTNYWTQSGETIYNLGNVGIGTTSPQGRLEVQGDGLEVPDEPLFEVKRKDGQTVFAVYPEGVRVYVEDLQDSKGTKGGFAIGGIRPGKGITNEYFRVTPDSIRMYVEQDTTTTKGTKGGFAIGGIRPVKGTEEEYLRVTHDSVRVYINDNPSSKGTKGGFAIGGFSPLKGLSGDYLNVSGKATAEIIDPSDARVLWYPNKEAFLTGRVLIESPDSIGTNSMATGFESKAIGDYSQALGYQAIARGDYSIAIGKNSLTNGSNSFAFGNNAFVIGNDAVAIGSGAIASANNSYAFGSVGIDTLGNPTTKTVASGEFSYALGLGSQSDGRASISIGANSTATGDFSAAFGPYADATGEKSVSIGMSHANGLGSVAMGWMSDANGDFSTAAGINTTANGSGSTAMGVYTTAQAYLSFVVGRGNVVSGSTDTWVSTDPLFVIGNGNILSPSNAMTVLKNGQVGIGINDPTAKLHVSGTGGRTIECSATGGTTNVTGLFASARGYGSVQAMGVVGMVYRDGIGNYYSGYFRGDGAGGNYYGLRADLITGVKSDIAEYILDSEDNTEPGDIVIADPDNVASIVKSFTPYDAKTLGVISTSPHMIMNIELIMNQETGEHYEDIHAAQLALAGRVPVKVTDENGSIEIGDFVTTSSKPGYGMKWSLLDVTQASDFEELKTMIAENERRRGAIVGKALEAHESGDGKIIVLVSLQ